MKILSITAIIVFLDQLSKLLVKGFKIPFLNFTHYGMYHGQRIPIIDDFFRFTFIENPGMAFGYDPGVDFKLYLSIFSLVASIGLFIYFYIARHQSLSLRVALAFILGGAVGNLIDRMFYGVFYGYATLFHGKVVDFLDFDFFNITILGRSYDRFPIFNIADASVTIGVMIMIIFYKHHHKETEIAITGAIKGDESTDTEPISAESTSDTNTTSIDLSSDTEPMSIISSSGINNPVENVESPVTNEEINDISDDKLNYPDTAPVGNIEQPSEDTGSDLTKDDKDEPDKGKETNI